MTQLSHAIKLEGQWEVAIVEFQYPCTFMSVTEDSMIYVYANEHVEQDTVYIQSIRPIDQSKRITQTVKAFPMAAREYPNVADLVAAINSLEGFSEYGMFHYYPHIEMMYVHINNSAMHRIVLSPSLALKLNFQQEYVKNDLVTTRSVDESGLVHPIVKTFPMIKKEYADVSELVNTINSLEGFKKFASLMYDSSTKKVTINTEPDVHQLELTSTLALQLGFDPNEDNMKVKNESIRPADLKLGLPKQIYIYCDIIDAQFIGDTKAPLIQTANVDMINYYHGANQSIQFLNPHYVPVLKTNFECIEIDLRDHTGKPLAFQFGTSCVKLHFHRIDS